MTAWPGGPCPDCGEQMPENLIHCQNCRAMLNDDFQSDIIEIPGFVPLEEISAMIELEVSGYFFSCPKCERELKANKKYLGEDVVCKQCDGHFKLDEKKNLRAFYVSCPYCKKELKAAMKYMGTKVSCKFCDGSINLSKEKSGLISE